MKKAVGGAMSLVGTGSRSGKIPLLLPVEAVVSQLETEELQPRPPHCWHGTIYSF